MLVRVSARRRGLAARSCRDDDPQVDHARQRIRARRHLVSTCSPTTTCTSGPTRTGRRRSATSPPRTSIATSRRAEAAGIAELGVSEHIHRFTQSLELWDHPFWREQALDDLDAYCEFVRGTELRLGIEMDFVPGAEDRTANLLEARDFDYVVGSVHFIGDDAVDHEGFDIWEGSGDPDRVWAPLLRGARRGRPLGPVRHPRPPRPGQGLGQGTAAARPRPPRLLRARGRGDRRERGRGRGLDRRPAQAGRRALPVARLRRDVRRGRRRLRPLLRRPPARAGRVRLRAGGRVPRRASGWGRSASSSTASGDWSRSDEPGSGSATTATASAPAARWSSAGSRSSTSSGSRATPTPTSSPTR